MSAIKFVFAREILDSRGNPTVEVDIRLEDGTFARAAVPSGASTGANEACELRDEDKSRYGGKGAQKAVNNVNTEIAKAIIGMDASAQSEIDETMIKLDGTENKSRLGANAILGVSLAVARAAAISSKTPLYEYIAGGKAIRMPTPMFNVLNGGVHANWQGPDFQEFMIVPVGAPTFKEALRYAAETYQNLKKVLKEAGHSVGVGDEGGFAPALPTNADAVEMILKAIEKSGYKPGDDIMIALDPASGGFYENGLYNLRSEGKKLTSTEMVDLYESWLGKYPLVVLEDGLAEDDWDGWDILNARLGSKLELVGDDIFVTNPKFIARGIERNTANGVLIKLNKSEL